MVTQSDEGATSDGRRVPGGGEGSASGTAQPSVFSFRAEFPADVDEFYAACAEAGIVVSAPSTRGLQEGFADVAAEFRSTSDVTVEHLRRAANDVPDLHVVLETLRRVPLVDNSLERQEFAQQVAQ